MPTLHFRNIDLHSNFGEGLVLSGVQTTPNIQRIMDIVDDLCSNIKISNCRRLFQLQSRLVSYDDKTDCLTLELNKVSPTTLSIYDIEYLTDNLSSVMKIGGSIGETSAGQYFKQELERYITLGLPFPVTAKASILSSNTNFMYIDIRVYLCIKNSNAI